MKKKYLLSAISLLVASHAAYGQKTWTLQECFDYALDNNIQLQQKKIAAASSHEDVLQSKSALFPSISFNTNQNVSWRPFAETTINLTNGSMTTNRNTVSYNGSYGINANWTVWNGNRRDILPMNRHLSLLKETIRRLTTKRRYQGMSCV